MNLRFIFLVFSLFFFSTSFGNGHLKNSAIPPDSTTSIVDKSAAIIMLEEGKRLFSEGKVRDALNQFRSVVQKDPNNWRPLYWIGVCHYSMSNYGFALKYANDALKINSPRIEEEVFELLGKSYHQLGKLDSAIINYEDVLTKISPSRAKDLGINWKIEQCRYAQSLKASGEKPARVRLKGEVNTGYNEYSQLLSSDGKTMYFTSRRSDTKGGKANPDDQEYFEDTYRAFWNEETQMWDSITNGIDRVNSDGFDSFSHLSTDGLTALMTINTSLLNSDKATNSSDIFELSFSNKGKWSTPKRIKNKTINTSFFEGSPTMTADGNTLYFVSDRKGQKKSTDIYVSKKVDKVWGDAVLLSDTINSTGTETTPYITPDGRYLFFSSDGHLGMGGLDVFVSENLGDSWSKPINLGIKINSVNNDTHFKYYPELKKAVLSGFEIVGQKSSIDMYEIDMTGFEYPVVK
jgi:tetratricopeptide (TPR) repeat protein